jgi:integrase
LPGFVRFKKRMADGSIKIYSYPGYARKGTAPRAAAHADGTIGACQQLYRQSPEWRALKPRTQAQYLHYLKFWEPMWHYRIEEIGREQIISQRNLIAERRGDQAANVFVRVTSAFFTWLVEAGRLTQSPAWRIKKIKGGGHFPAWSEADYEYAVARLPEHLRRVVVLARNTGQRRGDLIAMTWADYKSGGIRIVQEKGRQSEQDVPMFIPLSAEMRAELEIWKRTAASTHILTTDRGVPWHPTYLSRLLREAVDKLGLPAGLNVHGLRKLAATTLAEAGCSLHEIMAFTGHKTMSMVELYTRSARQERLANQAIIRLADHRKK